MTVRRGETTVQSSITPIYEKSKNLRKPQQLSEIKACTSIVHPPTYNTMNGQGKRMSQEETRSLIVEPQLHSAQTSVPNQMNTVPLHAVDKTVLHH